MTFLPVFLGYTYLGDWDKHRSIILSLYSNPINPNLEYFDIPGLTGISDARLVYYYSMHIPPAFLLSCFSRLFEITNLVDLAYHAQVFFAVWCFIGLVLVILLLPVGLQRIFKDFAKNRIYGLFYLFLPLFFGLNYLRQLYDTGLLVNPLVEWHVFYYVSTHAFIHFWQWSPAQTVSLLTGLFFTLFFIGSNIRLPLILSSLFVLSSSALVWIAFIPLAIFLYLSDGNQDKFSRLFSHPHWIVFLILTSLLIVNFYVSKAKPEDLQFNRSLEEQGVLLNLIIHLFVELFPLLFFLLVFRLARVKIPQVLYFSLFFIVLLFFFEVGRSNDLAMKATLPYYFLFFFFTSKIIEEKIYSKSLIVRLLILVFIVLSLPALLNDLCYWRSFYGTHWIMPNMKLIIQFAGRYFMDFLV